MWAFYMDAGAHMIYEEQIGRGSFNRVEVCAREIVNGALKNRATYVVLAHNHPSGMAEPSDLDRILTRSVSLVASTVDLQLHDHLVVGADEVFSFRSHGLL